MSVHASSEVFHPFIVPAMRHRTCAVAWGANDRRKARAARAITAARFAPDDTVGVLRMTYVLPWIERGVHEFTDVHDSRSISETGTRC